MAHVNVRHTRRGIALHSPRHDIEVSLDVAERIEGGIIPALFLCAPGRAQIDKTARIHTTIKPHEPNKGLEISDQFSNM